MSSLDNSLPSFRKADGATRAAAARAMEDRGLQGIDRLLAANTPTAILGWCKWWDGQRGVDAGLLAQRIFAGKPAPKPASVDLDEQKAYGDSIRDWLLAKMPDVCRVDPRVIAGHRRCYGDAEAVGLEHHAEPHYAAVAAVIRLHWRHGRGALTVRQHGPEIRAAVKRANDEAAADYAAIASKQREERM